MTPDESEPGTARTRRSPSWWWAFALVLGVPALVVVLISQLRAYSGPPYLGLVPRFSLVDQTGQAFSSADVAGKPWVAGFIFTRCAGTCPLMTARMGALQKEGGVRLVSFTVDPEHDTPEVLARYAQATGAGPEWRFATGPRVALHALATGGFRLAAMEVPPEQRQAGGDGPFLHSSHLVLVDGRGHIRGYYDTGDDGAMQGLRRDLARLRSGE